MKSRLFIGILLLIGLLPFAANAQFVYEVESSPDSAKVYVNGVLRGTTPCKIKFEWASVPDSGLVFRVKKANYTDEVFTLKEKPRVIKSFKKVTLQKILAHFELDPESPLIEFDRLLAEFPSGKEVGVIKRGGYGSKPLTWDGFSRLGSDPMNIKTYDVLGSTGFNTPMKESHQLFSTESRTKKNARFLLGAKVVKLWLDISLLNTYTEEYSADVAITLEWQVFDRSTNQVVLKGLSDGREKKKYHGSSEESALVDAYGDALYNFIAKGTLYELIKNAGTASVVSIEKGDSTTTTDLTKIPAIKVQKFENSPEMIQYSTQACVTISTDAGHGSGALITDDGYILTAEHVVSGVNRLTIIFSNGVELEAKLVASDAKYDVALLKVPGSKYKALPLGQGLTTGLGEEAITIGTPGDVELGQSISKGILSGKRKQDEIVYLQTDLAVSPGNSGGPLMNSKGQVIGIIQRKLTGQGIEGVGFALPIETALKRLNITVNVE